MNHKFSLNEHKRLISKTLKILQIPLYVYIVYDVYESFHRTGPKSRVANVFFQRICVYANSIIPKVSISSNCAVNSHILLSERFGIFVLSPNVSLSKHSNNNLINISLLRFSLHLDCKYIFVLLFYKINPRQLNF